MNRRLLFTEEADKSFRAIAENKSQKGLYSQILKTIGFLECNPKHPSLKTHEYFSLKGRKGERVWEAYVQNKTPGAYRVFFYYGPDELKDGKHIPVITIIAINPHP